MKDMGEGLGMEGNGKKGVWKEKERTRKGKRACSGKDMKMKKKETRTS